MLRIGFVVIVATMHLLSGCSGLELPGDYDELTMEKRSYTGGQLRTDGFYYYHYSTPKGDRYDVYFLNRNGIVRYIGTPSSLDYVSNNASFPRERYYWGLFRISGDQLVFERWHPGSGGYNPAFVHSGKILDDTTFVITEQERSKTGEEGLLKESRTFHFQEFSPKPDSTSKYIE